VPLDWYIEYKCLEVKATSNTYDSLWYVISILYQIYLNTWQSMIYDIYSIKYTLIVHSRSNNCYSTQIYAALRSKSNGVELTWHWSRTALSKTGAGTTGLWNAAGIRVWLGSRARRHSGADSCQRGSKTQQGFRGGWAHQATGASKPYRPRGTSFQERKKEMEAVGNFWGGSQCSKRRL
jgi:hypothetical protein